MSRVSAKRAELIRRLTDPPEGWQAVPVARGRSIRWMQTVPTPAYALKPGPTGRPYWAEPTFDRIVFVTLVAADATPIVGVWRVPWVPREDRDVPLRRALEIIDDPEHLYAGQVIGGPDDPTR